MMPTVQVYKNDKKVRLFDRHLVVDFSHSGYAYDTGFSKNGTTRLLGRMGYVRTSSWEESDWGWEAKFSRQMMW